MTIKNTFTILVFSIALLLPFAARAQNRQLIQDDEPGQKRVALVIGNGDYASARKLVNPANDAGDMAKTLRDVGFEVVSGTNLNLKQMTEKVREFGDKLKASGGVGLFYYAGHGVQLNNKNYLIPVEADITREDEIDFAALNFDQILRKMATANNGLNIVILDACRNNPFARSWSRGEDEGGLAQISAPTGTFIAYATSPDRTASDGTGRNGLYTAELLKYIKQPNLKIEETFKEVRKAVNKASSGKQIPWDSSSLSGDFYFTNRNAVTSVSIKSPNVASPIEPAASKVNSTTTKIKPETSDAMPPASKSRNNSALASFAKVMNTAFAKDYQSKTIRTRVQFLAAGQTENWVFGAIPADAMKGKVPFRVSAPGQTDDVVPFGSVPPHVFLDKAESDLIFELKKGDFIILTGSTVVGTQSFGGGQNYTQIIFVATGIEKSK